MTSCSTEQPEATPAATQGRVPLQLTVGIASPADGGTLGTTRTAIATAASTATPQNTQLDQDELVSVFFSGGSVVTADGTAVASAEMKKGTGTTISATTKINGTDVGTDDNSLYLQFGEVQTWIDMFYPTQDQAATPVSTGPAMTSFTVAQDQSDDTGYRASDLMYGHAALTSQRPLDSYSQQIPAVTLQHRMAQLIITATPDTEVGAVQEVRLVRGFRTVNMGNPMTATPGTTLTTPITRELPLTALKDGTTAGARTCAALLPPQTVLQGDFIEVQTERGTATFRLAADKELQSGRSYQIAVTVSRASLGTTIDITDWSAQDYRSHQSAQQMLSFYVNGVPFNMVFVEGGEYSTLRGVNVTGRLSDFYIGETEVTFGLWKAVRGAGAIKTDTQNGFDDTTAPNKPIARLRYDVVTAFINDLNTLLAAQLPTGWRFTRPTEAQWEYAARDGKARRTDYILPGSTTNGSQDVVSQYAYNKQASGFSSSYAAAPVAQLIPNGLGIYDLCGNMWESLDDYTPTITAGSDLGLDYYGTTNTGDYRAGGTFEHDWNGTNMRITGRYLADKRSGEWPNATSAIDFGARLALVRGYGFGYTGTVQTFTAPQAGKYRIECWGAQGGTPPNRTGYTSVPQPQGGKGAYATGVVTLAKDATLSIYVGQQGQTSTTSDVASAGGWNGGGNGGKPGEGTYNSGGGGATDVRQGGTALTNRIIVAGAGGGAVSYATPDNNATDSGWAKNGFTYVTGLGIVANGGHGGAMVGGGGLWTAKNNGTTSCYDPTTQTLSTGGTQDSNGGKGYKGTYNGSDGAAGTGGAPSGSWGGGGGGGYYGGGGGGHNSGIVCTGAGGSSYTGGVANGQMIGGNAEMPAPQGGTEPGHTGNGYCRITYVGQ